jgi:hypothetical protein
MSVTKKAAEAGATVAQTLAQIRDTIDTITDPKQLVQEVFKWDAVKQNSEIFSYHVRPPPVVPFLPF